MWLYIESHIDKLHDDITCNSDMRNTITLAYHLTIMEALISENIIYLEKIKQYNKEIKRIYTGDKFKFVLNSINDFVKFRWELNLLRCLPEDSKRRGWPNGLPRPLTLDDSLTISGYNDKNLVDEYTIFKMLDNKIMAIGISKDSLMEQIRVCVDKIYIHIEKVMYEDIAESYNVGNIYK